MVLATVSMSLRILSDSCLNKAPPAGRGDVFTRDTPDLLGRAATNIKGGGYERLASIPRVTQK